MKEASQAMLNVVFDASCECEATGRLVTCSQQFQNLMRLSSDTTLSLDLAALAAKHRIAQIAGSRSFDCLLDRHAGVGSIALRARHLVLTQSLRQGKVFYDIDEYKLTGNLGVILDAVRLSKH